RDPFRAGPSVSPQGRGGPRDTRASEPDREAGTERGTASSGTLRARGRLPRRRAIRPRGDALRGAQDESDARAAGPREADRYLRARARVGKGHRRVSRARATHRREVASRRALLLRARRARTARPRRRARARLLE